LFSIAVGPNLVALIFLIEDCLLVELKSVNVLSIHKAQLLSYMKLLNIPIGLLINRLPQERFPRAPLQPVNNFG
jgi:GxxExxY protein